MLRLIPDPLREAATALGATALALISKVAFSRRHVPHHYRHPSRHRAHQRRNRALIFTALGNTQLSFDPKRADGEPAVHDLQFARQPVANCKNPAHGAGALYHHPAVLPAQHRRSSVRILRRSEKATRRRP